MNYFEQVMSRLEELHPNMERDYYRAYALLVFVKGQKVTLEDVHDAWAMVRNETNPNHKDLVRFKKLPATIAEWDRPYAESIKKVAEEIGE
jgi:hypothetical protein